MGKQVTVLNGFTDVMLPTVETVNVASAINGQNAGTIQIVTLAAYSSGATTILTDAEYSGLSSSTTRALTTPNSVADPSRPSSDPRAAAVTTNAAVTGSYTAAIGTNVVTLTGSVATFVFPTVPTGSASTVDLVITQGTGGSKTITWPSAAKFPAATAPTLSTAAAKVDRVVFVSRGDGATWDFARANLDLR